MCGGSMAGIHGITGNGIAESNGTFTDSFLRSIRDKDVPHESKRGSDTTNLYNPDCTLNSNDRKTSSSTINPPPPPIPLSQQFDNRSSGSNEDHYDEYHQPQSRNSSRLPVPVPPPPPFTNTNLNSSSENKTKDLGIALSAIGGSMVSSGVFVGTESEDDTIITKKIITQSSKKISKSLKKKASSSSSATAQKSNSLILRVEGQRNAIRVLESEIFQLREALETKKKNANMSQKKIHHQQKMKVEMRRSLVSESLLPKRRTTQLNVKERVPSHKSHDRNVFSNSNSNFTQALTTLLQDNKDLKSKIEAKSLTLASQQKTIKKNREAACDLKRNFGESKVRESKLLEEVEELELEVGRLRMENVRVNRKDARQRGKVMSVDVDGDDSEEEEIQATSAKVSQVSTTKDSLTLAEDHEKNEIKELQEELRQMRAERNEENLKLDVMRKESALLRHALVKIKTESKIRKEKGW